MGVCGCAGRRGGCEDQGADFGSDAVAANYWDGAASAVAPNGVLWLL